jgi:hypothetical protein
MARVPVGLDALAQRSVMVCAPGQQAVADLRWGRLSYVRTISADLRSSAS